MALAVGLAEVDVALRWLATTAPLLTSIAAVTGAVIAVLGYRKWLPEIVGTRKVELAEEIISSFYQARDTIAWARFPGSWGNEAKTREASGLESEQEKAMKDAYFLPIERLRAQGELFSGLQSKKYRAMAYFGPEAAKPFDRLKSVHGEIMTAASMLIRTYRRDERPVKSHERWLEKIGWNDESDSATSLSKEIDSIITQVERFYGHWLIRR